MCYRRSVPYLSSNPFYDQVRITERLLEFRSISDLKHDFSLKFVQHFSQGSTLYPICGSYSLHLQSMGSTRQIALYYTYAPMNFTVSVILERLMLDMVFIHL